MKIVALQAENFKRLSAVFIKPSGNMVEIAGRNGQGKSSVLDAIWVALAGKSVSPSMPIRKGQQAARILLDLGEIKVTRTFRKAGDGEVTTNITVENAEGARFPSPQKMLDTLLGELAFDPLAFERMKPREQFDALRRFVPGVEFEAIDNANRGDFERRADFNRFAKQERAAASLIYVPENTPSEPVDEQALVQALREAGDLNTETERRRSNRARVAEQITALRRSAEETIAKIEPELAALHVTRESAIADIEEQIRALNRQVDAIKLQYQVDYAATEKRLTAEANSARIKADELQAQLDGAERLPAIIDATALSAQIEAARKTNELVRKRNERKAHEQKAEAYEAQAEQLTLRIEKRNSDKQAAIAAAKMPIDGIEFGDGEVLLNGVPFAQASDAERLSTSVAIAMATNPKLRVVRIRDGSLLDEQRMQQLAEMAEANDIQVWIERVDSSGKIGFVLEDGMLKATETAQAGAA